MLEKAKGYSPTGAAEIDFQAMSLAALSDYIVRNHYSFTRAETNKIAYDKLRLSLRLFNRLIQLCRLT